MTLSWCRFCKGFVRWVVINIVNKWAHYLLFLSCLAVMLEKTLIIDKVTPAI